MEITHIHSFLVKPLKGSTDSTALSGTDVPLSGKLFEMLSGVFVKAEKECIFEIGFCAASDGTQTNVCKDLIVEFVKEPNRTNGEKIAARLQTFTDNRSGLGLLFLIVGKNENTHKIVISRFPADSGILAEETSSTLSVKFLERIFMKNSHFYKSALYQGRSFDNDFWDGWAGDKQMLGELRVADYWIREFLSSDLKTLGYRGSVRVGRAFQEAFNETTDSNAKEEIIAAIRLADAQEGKVHNVDSLLSALNLSEPTKAIIRSRIPHAVQGEFFNFLAKEAKSIAAFKSVELDTGVRITADAKGFDELIVQKEIENGKVVLSTEGIIVDERLRRKNK